MLTTLMDEAECPGHTWVRRARGQRVVVSAIGGLRKRFLKM